MKEALIHCQKVIGSNCNNNNVKNNYLALNQSGSVCLVIVVSIVATVGTFCQDFLQTQNLVGAAGMVTSDF